MILRFVGLMVEQYVVVVLEWKCLTEVGAMAVEVHPRVLGCHRGPTTTDATTVGTAATTHETAHAAAVEGK